MFLFLIVCELTPCCNDISPDMWDLESGANDPRVPESLAYHATERSCWLSPLSQSMTNAERLNSIRRVAKSQHAKYINNAEDDTFFFDHNVLFILFHQAVKISAIRCLCYFCLHVV